MFTFFTPLLSLLLVLHSTCLRRRMSRPSERKGRNSKDVTSLLVSIASIIFVYDAARTYFKVVEVCSTRL